MTDQARLEARASTPLERASTALARRAWTASEVEQMVEAGILGEAEPFELIEGELVRMAPKNRRHEIVRTELQAWLTRAAPAHIKVAGETPLKLSDYDVPEPDIVVFPAHLKAPDVTAGTVLLVIECADASLSYDLTAKAKLYASFGVPEYWVVSAVSFETTVQRRPTSSGYSRVLSHRAEEMLIPTLAPELALRLADLDLG